MREIAKKHNEIRILADVKGKHFTKFVSLKDAHICLFWENQTLNSLFADSAEKTFSEAACTVYRSVYYFAEIFFFSMARVYTAFYTIYLIT